MILFEKTVFPVLNFDADHDWYGLLSLGAGYVDKPGIDRLRFALESHCHSVIIEREYIDKDYRNTYANFHAKRFTTPPSRCVRLHFFTKHLTQEAIDSGYSLLEDNNEYLGYSVIRATRPNSVGRTFLSDKVRQDPDAHLCLCKEKVHVLGETLAVSGFPFISQDSDATVCAESSLWMILRYFSNRYPNYAETLPFQITQLANNHAIGRRVFPSGGLSSWQLSEALRINTFSPLIYSRPSAPPQGADAAQIAQYQQATLNFEHLLYTYIESGFPLLTTVNGHVFPAFGHSSDFTAPPAQTDGKPIYSSIFNKSITISDDNCYPYQILHRRTPAADASSSDYTFPDINQFIVPLPEKVFLSAENAQAVIENMMANVDSGISANSPTLAGKKLTLRLFLTSSRSFKLKIKERGMGHPIVARMYQQIPLPHFIWICEISLTDEYCSDNNVLGEILWDATRNANEPDGWIAVHYPELLSIDIGSSLNQPQRIQKIPLDNHTNYPLFKSNLKPIQP